MFLSSRLLCGDRPPVPVAGFTRWTLWGFPAAEPVLDLGLLLVNVYLCAALTAL